MDPERLLEDILADPDPNSPTVGVLTNKLLREYHRGYPLENLKPLLQSENERLLMTDSRWSLAGGRRQDPKHNALRSACDFHLGSINLISP